MHDSINLGDIVRISDDCRYYEKRYNGMLGYVTSIDLNSNTRYVRIFEDPFCDRGQIFFALHHLEKVDSKNGLR
jgi:hypothetical protein